MPLVETPNGTLIPDINFDHDISLYIRFDFSKSEEFFPHMKKAYDKFKELFEENGVYPKLVNVDADRINEIWTFKTNKNNAFEDKAIVAIITKISDNLYEIFNETILENSDIQVDFASSKGSLYSVMVKENDKFVISNIFQQKFRS